MMADSNVSINYKRVEWQDGLTPLNEENLNMMDQGIYDLDKSLGAAEADISLLKKTTVCQQQRIDNINTLIEQGKVIKSFETSKTGLTTTIKVIFVDETSQSFEVTDGVTPVIESAAGSNIDVVGTPTVTQTNNGNTTIFTFDYLKGVQGDVGPQGPQGEKGNKGSKGDTGATGNGVASISKTSTEGLVDTYTITYTDGTTSTFTVTNGKDGKDGATGESGSDASITWNEF